MRFFAHDGKTLHGPSTVAELIALPGFGGDTLVCPVGATDSTDWKPALTYPIFRQVLLAPAPKPEPPITKACPKCAHANPDGARYCNSCAARMDGNGEPPAPIAEVVESPAEEPPRSSTMRNALIVVFVGTVLASCALGWRLMRPVRRSTPVAARPTPAIPEPALPLPEPQLLTPAISTAPPTTPAVLAPVPPPPVIKPVTAPPLAPKIIEKPPTKIRRAPKPKRVARPRPKIEPPAKTAEQAPGPAPEASGGFMLPGIPRPVSKPATQPVESVDGGAQQVREQFDFCAQLLAQGAYADHFDTCLCTDVRLAAPYRGRRDLYAAELKKSSPPERSQTKVEILAVEVSDNSATVKALWKTAAAGASQESSQRWRLEDGLWCRAP